MFRDYVPREKFFNRKEELDYFRRSISVDRKILLCIVAPLKYGKTSLMMRYYEMLKEFSDVIPIYVDLRMRSTPIRFIVRELEKYGLDMREKYVESVNEGSLEPLFEEICEDLRAEG